MSANSINKKGEVLKMLLKVSDLSETKSIFIFKFKIIQGSSMWTRKYKNLMQQQKADSIIWVAIIISLSVT
jgi:hypothetical protein